MMPNLLTASFPFLSLAIVCPILWGIVVLVFGRDEKATWTRCLSVAGAAVSFLVTLPLLFLFDKTFQGLQFVEQHTWIKLFHVNYDVGIDGISLWLVLLSALMTLIVIVASYKSIEKQIASYMGSFLILSGLLIGVFCAFDGLLFYVFFEATLIPMFIIIGVWGGARRVYAAFKFFLYTFVGSLPMLIALMYLYFKSSSFNLFVWYDLPLTHTEQIGIFIAFLLSFAVKLPMWPVHTWLPDAHVEAPTGGSVILAAIMLKLGAYGFVRLSLPILPDASRSLAWLMITLSLIAIIYIGLVALVQKDMKKLIAYSSIAHMGFVTLGFFLANNVALNGAIVQVISHGFISAALFLCVGVLYDRMHTREIKDYGGVVHVMPRFSAFFMLFALANCGLPGTSGFIGEVMVIIGAVQENMLIGCLCVLSMILGAAYTLWLVKRVFFGEIVNEAVRTLKEITTVEAVLLLVLALLVVSVGVYPAWIIDTMQLSVSNIFNYAMMSKI